MAMKRPKFVRVVTAPLPRAGTTIEGVRRKDDVLAMGQIVPIEWFADTPDEVFLMEINPTSAGGWGCIEEVTPDTKQMMLLREQYPDVFAARDKQDSPTVKATRKTNKSEDGE